MTELVDKEFSRKTFLKGGGALIVGLGVAGAGFAAAAQAEGTFPAVAPTSLDSWIIVHPDNTVTVLAGKLEYGQGTTTSLRQIAADELDIGVDQILWVRPQTGVTPNQGGTYGSNGTASGGQQIRAAAAFAKQALLGLAATSLGVPAASLTVERGVVSGGGKSVKYSDLVGGKLFNVNMPTTTLQPSIAPAKTPAQYRIVGTRVPRVDIPEKVTGAFTYMHSVRIPGMLHGRVVRPRGQAAYGSGAKPLAIDEGSIKHIPDVQIVRKGDFVGVVAPKEYSAIQAAALLKVTWADPPTKLPGSGNVFKQMRSQDAAGQTTNAIRAAAGDVGPALAGASKVLSATYSFGYQTHGPIGPNCAIADAKPGSAMVLSSTQDIYTTQQFSLSKVLGMPPSQITVQYWDGGGTFGSSCFQDVATAAAVMSQSVGKPVRVQFMRWDEHGWDTYGPAMLADVRAGIDAQGRIVAYDSVAWGHPYVPYFAGETTRELIGMPIPVAEIPAGGVDTGQTRYNILNRRVTGKSVNLLNGYLMASYLRQPLAPQNNFIAEQMIDELAHAANMDPIAFRRLNIDGSVLAGQRGLAVLDALSQVSGWQPKVAASKLGSGTTVTGRGMAWTGQQAVTADIEVNTKTGRIVVKHLYAVQDPGLAINPASVESQIMGNMIMTASRALVEEVKFGKQRVTGLDWVSYPILRFKDHPKVTAVVVNRPDQNPSGAGEATTGPVTPAIANAFFDATGVRIRQAPMTPGKVRAALAAAGK